jgi:26S proteasome regulatory subunit (ATPase 3-interacting protein)
MKRENRPFNAIQLHENFHKRMPKSVLEKALESLSDGKGIRCKEYGKSKIYFADQSTIPCGSDKEIKDLNNDIEKLKRTLDSVSQELSNLKSELNILESEPNDHNLDTSLNTLEASISEKKLRASQITESILEPNALNNAIKEHNYFRTIWKQRKEICNDVIDQIMESTKKKKHEYISDIGLDTDEDMKESLPAVVAEIKK